MIKSKEELRSIYAQPGSRAIEKSLNRLDRHGRHFIEKSPFVMLATRSASGQIDVSPRGGAPGFVAILNDRTIVIPDFKGNNRLDSLNNIIETGQAGLLFLIPGMDETLRVQGLAHLSADEKYLALFKSEKNLMGACIVVELETQFLHCAKAFMRSELWSPESIIDRNEFPSMGQMLKDQLNSSEEPESRADMIERYKKEL